MCNSYRSPRPGTTDHDEAVTNEPISLQAALATFETLWSPRIVARVNDHDVRIAKVAGEHIWHAHDDTDELFLVLNGELSIALRDAGPDHAGAGAGRAERLVVLARGSLFVVPRGVEHKPFSAAGASILMVESTGTSSVGNRHDPVPGHVDATIGHAVA
jgi:mannose-6-phosphate isomerase-like protein (cupin superfamily)